MKANFLTVLVFWCLPAILIGFAGTNKRGGFLRAFILSITLSPIIGLFITLGSGQRNPKGCLHCGNKYNEAEVCGLCGKSAIDVVDEIGSTE